MTHLIKIISFAVLFTVLSAVSAQAQTAKKMKPQKHHCTEQCANGKHAYKHGEKKHQCDATCQATGAAAMTLKDHVCTDACKNGQHAFLHGEKGHTCDANCKQSK